MKVLLINPSYPFEESPTPPFGLMSASAYLLEHGVEVQIEDYIVTPYNKERVHKVLREYNPDVVGATGVTMNINTSLQILRDYREINPDISVVMGGPHVTFDPDNILRNNSFVDYIVRGEGEVTFLELLEKIDSRSSLTDVKGISYKEKGSVIHNENRPFIEDINVLPYPARHLVQLSKYKALRYPVNMITGRGCPFNCIFCVGKKMVGKKVRYFDVERVVDEFEMLSKMGFRQINIVDDLFTSNKKRCISICDEIMRRGISHKWNAFSRVDTISDELLKKLKEAGCIALCFGIESGNQEILDAIKKKTTLEKCQRAIDLCNKYDIEAMCSYILGLPGENRETIKQTQKFASELSTNYGFHILAPFPGTEIRERSHEYGIKILTDDWDKYDANQSVCEYESIHYEEIDLIAENYDKYIDGYIAKIRKKDKMGEIISKKEKDIIEGIDNFNFAKHLILEELIETYPGLQNGASSDAIIDDFILYVEKNTEYTREEVSERISNFFDLNCLRMYNNQGRIKIIWV